METDFIGLNVAGYVTQEYIGSGAIGRVYCAKGEEFGDFRAIKFIPKENIDSRPNWGLEIKKVLKLRLTEGVVPYHSHELVTICGDEYWAIMWDYVPSESLKKITQEGKLSVSLLVDVIERVLKVMHACSQIGIQHADLHAGNILIQDPDPLDMRPEYRKVWITDFGYGTFSTDELTMDDYRGLARVISDGIASIDIHTLESADRRKFNVLKNEFPKLLLETNEVFDSFTRSPEKLTKTFFDLLDKPIGTNSHPKTVGDYLAAELIGQRYDEWDSLFVPKFLALSELLDQNTCILTGMRGCGKTMMFRRLSEEFVLRLGPANVPNEDGFLGFYVNARNIAEAFPWLPEHKESEARKQVLHYFNVRWTIEVLKWLEEEYTELPSGTPSINWLVDFLKQYIKDGIIVGSSAKNVISYLLNQLYHEVALSKLETKFYDKKEWLFSDYSYLEDFVTALLENCEFAQGKSIYFFLDDYSTPLVTRATQRILNPVIFRRASSVFFKVSVESFEAFVSEGLNGKNLVATDDYKLIDLSFICGQTKAGEVADIIDSIFARRLDRHSYFAGKGLSLTKILGSSDMSNTQRAMAIRESDKRAVYYGIDVFRDMWTSDIRELIKMFSAMVSRDEEQIPSRVERVLSGDLEAPIIGRDTQNTVILEAGGKFLHRLVVVSGPKEYADAQPSNVSPELTYGRHLRDIVLAFQKMAYHNLKTKNSKNGNTDPPKQVRRIELKSSEGDLSDISKICLQGLIRYGVFIHDPRAKAIEGNPTHRYLLRGLLIPLSRLTFSKRDSIFFTFDEFNRFLEKPQEFATAYKKRETRKRKEQQNDRQTRMDL